MKMDKQIKDLPKAELHVHVEGTVTPSMARKLAKKHNIDLPDDIFTPDGKGFVWNDFLDCVTRVYNAVAETVQTKEDYEEIVYDYLKRSADEGCIYTELIAYPSHARHLKEKFPGSNLDYEDMIDGIVAGIEKANKETGIDARINVTLVRHDKPEWNKLTAEEIVHYQHPYVVGLDLAGGEQEGDIPSFKTLFDEIQSGYTKKLGIRVHAGEAAGVQNIHDAMDILNVSRIGHGIRAIEDINAIKKLVGRQVTLEVCPTSNVLVVEETPDFAAHPLSTLKQYGVRVTLNSDDPGLFGNSIGTEYQIAKDEFGFTDIELLDITRTAIESSYAKPELKRELLKEIDAYDFFLRRLNRVSKKINMPRP